MHFGFMYSNMTECNNRKIWVCVYPPRPGLARTQQLRVSATQETRTTDENADRMQLAYNTNVYNLVWNMFSP